MNPRATELIESLKLEPHPEGGFFAQAFRSERLVRPSGSHHSRPALTVIYFLLVEGSFGRWHRLLSDEAWHHYEGSPVEILTAPAAGGAVTRFTLLSSLPVAERPSFDPPSLLDEFL